MELFLVGVDRNVAPIDVRERLSLPKEAVPDALRRIREEGWADEALLLSTCNRTELYVVTRVEDGGERALRALLAALPGAPAEAAGLYRRRRGEAAAEHLFRVAAGLESALVGETEVQGQVRDAHDAAVAAGCGGKFLDRLVRGAVRAGKRARTETKVAAGGVSHGSAAADAARRVFGRLRGHPVLVVGAGAMAVQTARALRGLDADRWVVANRGRESAEALATELGGAPVVGLDALRERLAEAHVVVLAAESVALRRGDVEAVLARRRAPLLVVDLGVPRLAEPTIADLPGVFLYDVEDLEDMVAGAVAVRREAVPAVEAILAEEFGQFRAWQRTLRAHPTLRSLQEWAEEVRRDELQRLPRGLAPDTLEAIDEATRRLVQKLLGRPASRVVEGMAKEDPTLPTPEHLRAVFGLDDDAGSDDARPEGGS
jgi:glutamyl-tRNA reductase